MSKRVSRVRQYTDEQRINAAIQYAYKGSFSQVSRDTGVPRKTITGWSKMELWDEAVAKARHQINDQILANDLQIATKAGERVLDSLENGDEKLIWDKEKQEHVIKRVLPTGKEAAVMGGISQDKARVQLNMPTSIRADSSNMTALADQFRELSRTWNEKKVNSIPGESEEID